MLHLLMLFKCRRLLHPTPPGRSSRPTHPTPWPPPIPHCLILLVTVAGGFGTGTQMCGKGWDGRGSIGQVQDTATHRVDLIQDRTDLLLVVLLCVVAAVSEGLRTQEEHTGV